MLVISMKQQDRRSVDKMRHLILLNETASECARLAQLCNKVALCGEGVICPDTEVSYRTLMISSMVDVMAMVELLGQEYEVDKEKLLPLFAAKLEEVEVMIEEFQSNPSSQPESPEET